MAKKKKTSPDETPRSEEKIKMHADAEAASREAMLKKRDDALNAMKMFAQRKLDNGLMPLDQLSSQGRIKDGGQVAEFKKRLGQQVGEFIEAMAVLPEV